MNEFKFIIPALELDLSIEQKISVLLNKIITAEIQIGELQRVNAQLVDQLNTTRNQVWNLVDHCTRLQKQVDGKPVIVREVAANTIRQDHHERVLDPSL